MFIFPNWTKMLFEWVEKSAKVFSEHLSRLYLSYSTPYIPYTPYRRSYRKNIDYSKRDPSTWTLHDICSRIWLQVCLSVNEDQSLEHLWTLSLFQSEIADGPFDPRWTEFLDSHPGLREYISKYSFV